MFLRSVMAISMLALALAVHESSAYMIFIHFLEEKTQKRSIYALSEERVMRLSFYISFKNPSEVGGIIYRLRYNFSQHYSIEYTVHSTIA